MNESLFDTLFFFTIFYTLSINCSFTRKMLMNPLLFSNLLTSMATIPLTSPSAIYNPKVFPTSTISWLSSSKEYVRLLFISNSRSLRARHTLEHKSDASSLGSVFKVLLYLLTNFIMIGVLKFPYFSLPCSLLSKSQSIS